MGELNQGSIPQSQSIPRSFNRSGGQDGERTEKFLRFVEGEDFASRFKLTEFLLDAGKERYGLWEVPPMQFTGEEERFTVPVIHEGRPELISQFHYGTVDYWWAPMIANGISFPLRDLKAGMVLIIPSRNAVEASLRRIRQ